MEGRGSGPASGAAAVWSLEGPGSQRRLGASQAFSAKRHDVALSPNGGRLYTRNETVTHINLRPGRRGGVVPSPRHPGLGPGVGDEPRRVARGRHGTVEYGNEVLMLDAATGQGAWSDAWQATARRLVDVRFSADGHLLRGRHLEQPCCDRLERRHRGGRRRARSSSPSAGSGSKLSPDGTMLYTAGTRRCAPSLGPRRHPPVHFPAADLEAATPLRAWWSQHRVPILSPTSHSPMATATSPS